MSGSEFKSAMDVLDAELVSRDKGQFGSSSEILYRPGRIHEKTAFLAPANHPPTQTGYPAKFREY